MEHQRVVLDFVQATSFKEQSNMALEFFAMYESFFKALHDDFFFVGELMTSFKTVQSATFLALQSLTIVGVIYFILNFVLSRLLKILERRLMVSD